MCQIAVGASIMARRKPNLAVTRAWYLLLAVLLSTALAACDGAKLGDGLPTTAECDECHGNPPPTPHPEETNCYLCHPTSVTEADKITEGGTHANGSVETELGTCEACHGNPPPPPHPAADDCGQCHSGTVAEDGKLMADGLHMNGTVEAEGGHPEGYASPVKHGVDFNSGLAGSCTECHGEDLTGGTSTLSCDKCHSDWQTDCTFCHGDAGSNNPAPPPNVAGETDTSITGVGAHAVHLAGPSDWHGANITCLDCHSMPEGVLAADHVNGMVEVVFGELAKEGSAEPVWDGSACSSVYCHGGGSENGEGTHSTPVWTTVDGSQSQCGACHAMPPESPHSPLDDCSMCHGCVTQDNVSILGEGAHLHIDGDVNTDGAGDCPTAE